MSEGISYREFAAQCGVTCEGVRKAISTGKIPADCLGTIKLKTGTLRPCITDPVKAAESWGRNRNENLVRDKEKLSEGGKRGWEGRRAGADPAPSQDPKPNQKTKIEIPKAKDITDGIYPSVNDSKRQIEYINAQRAQANWDKECGRLVVADEFKAHFSEMIVNACNALNGVPTKAKSRIPHLTTKDIEILEDLISTALQEIADA